MSNKEDPAQRLDKLLLRLLKMPPQSRVELAEAVRHAKQEKPYLDPREARQRKKTTNPTLKAR